MLPLQINNCDVCHRRGKGLLKVRTELRQVAITCKVWHLLGMDLIGQLKETRRGNKYILTMICYFSKWPEAIPLQSKEATAVLQALRDVFARNAFPSRIITDNGGEFTSEVYVRKGISKERTSLL